MAWRWFVGGVFPLVFLAGCQPPALAPSPPTPDLQTYVNAPEHQALTLQVAKQAARWQKLQCVQATSFAPSKIVFATGPMTFAADGTPSRGIWSEQVAASGCGQTLLLNVAYQATGQGRPAGAPMAPGSSHADPLLQLDTFKMFRPVVEAVAPPCPEQPGYIYDTIFDGHLRDGPPGAWTEHWIAMSCGSVCPSRSLLIRMAEVARTYA